MLCGGPAAGKSFVLNLMILLSLPGSVHVVSRVTGQALVTGQSNAFPINIQHEGQPAYLVDGGDPTSGHRADKVGGDSEKTQLMKSMLTEGWVSTYAQHTDDATGKRSLTKFLSLVVSSWMIAINWDKRNLAGPIRDRFLFLEYRAQVKDPSPTSFSSHYRPMTMEHSNEMQHLVRNHHLVHSVVFVIYWLASTAALPAGILTDIGELLTNKVIEQLILEFNLPEHLVRVRHRDNMVAWMRAFCAFRVAVSLLATPWGVRFLKKNNCKPISEIAMLDFCYHQLYVTVADAVLALTMLEFQFDSIDEHDLLILLASQHFFNAHDKDMRRPLKVYASEILGSPNNTEAFKLELREISSGVDTDIEREVATASATLAHAADADMEAATRKVQELQTELDNHRETQRRHSERDSDPTLVIDDHRFDVMPWPGMAEFVSRIKSKMYLELGYSLRTETLEVSSFPPPPFLLFSA